MCLQRGILLILVIQTISNFSDTLISDLSEDFSAVQQSYPMVDGRAGISWFLRSDHYVLRVDRCRFDMNAARRAEIEEGCVTEV